MKIFFLYSLSLLLFLSCSPIEGRSEVEFGTLIVPENRNDPNSRQIAISYAVIPASQRSKKPPIVFIQGGPGGSSLGMVGFFSNSPLNDYHDIILFDARGTGTSEAFCEDTGSKFMEVMAKNMTVDEEYKATLEICEACKKELEANNVDLAGYNSLENAADLEALRKELKIDKWILFGGSYGTRLGFTYLREYGRAEAAVFMGLFPPEVNIYEGFVEGLDGALGYLFESCEGDSKCNEKYPELKNSFYSLIDELRANPKKVTYRGEDFYINAQDALLLIHQMLYQRQNIQLIPAFIYSLIGEESNVISRSINQTAQTLSFINVATYWSVQAKEELQFNEENAISKDLETYDYLKPGPAFFATDQLVLQQWHPYRSELIESEPVNVTIPILIVNGLFDPITPIQNARNVMKYLPNATLVEFENEGHTTFNSCFYSLFEDFVSRKDKRINPSCAKGNINWR